MNKLQKALRKLDEDVVDEALRRLDSRYARGYALYTCYCLEDAAPVCQEKLYSSAYTAYTKAVWGGFPEWWSDGTPMTYHYSRARWLVSFQNAIIKAKKPTRLEKLWNSIKASFTSCGF